MRYIPLFLGLFLSSAVMAEETMKNWPLKGENESAAKVQAAYKEQCEAWSKQRAEEGIKADADYINKCTQGMTAVWPVGVDNSSSGE